MSVRLSSGFRNAVCATAPILALMDGGTIYLYGGTIPESPDNPPNTPLLGQVTTKGLPFSPSNTPTEAGLRIQWVHPGVLMMDGNWVLKGVANGTVAWFRWCWREHDPLGESAYYPRLDGTIGDVLRMSNKTMTTSRVDPVEAFFLQLPVGG